MSNNFLNTGGGTGGQYDITTPLVCASVTAGNLDPNLPMKTTSEKKIVSSLLNISDVNNLQTELDNLESGAGSTGVVSGGVMTLVGAPDTSALFDISDGSGVIVDPAAGTKTDVSWSGLTNQSAVYTGILTFVSISSAGAVVYATSRPTNTQMRDQIFLGVLVHITNPLLLTTINNQQTVSTYPANQVLDLMKALEFINVSGNLLSAPSTDLTVAKSSGTMLAPGSNYENDVKNPHILTTPAIDTNAGGIFQYRVYDGSSSALTLTDIDPDYLDDGNPYGSGGTIASNKWGAQRIYVFTSGVMKIQPAQFSYNSAAEARGGIQTESFITEPSIAANGLLVGYIIVRGGATNLSLATDCEFLSAGKFGNAGSTVSGSVSTMQNTYDNTGTEPEILTDSTRGAVTIRRGSAADTDNVIEFQNNAGTTTTGISGDGRITVGEEVKITHTATENGDHALEIDHDAAGFSDSKAIDVVYTTGALAANSEEDVILMNVDKSASVGGEVLGVVMLATEGPANCIGLEVGAGCEVIKQLAGSFANPSTGNIDNNGATVALGSLSGVNLWANDNDYVIVADSTTFEEIEFLLGQVASGSGIAPTFEFSSGTGPLAWTSFIPTDGTNGMRNTGIVAWIAADTPGWITDGGVYKVKITRTRNSLGTVPQANNNGVKVAAVTEYGWDGDAKIECAEITTNSFNDTELAAATELIVNPSTGSDSTGTRGTALAFQTLKGAYDASSAGDRILCHAGDLGSTAFSITDAIEIIAIGDTFLNNSHTVSNVTINIAATTASRLVLSGINFLTNLAVTNIALTESRIFENCQFDGTVNITTSNVSYRNHFKGCFFKNIFTSNGYNEIETDCVSSGSHRWTVQSGKFYVENGFNHSFPDITHTGGEIRLCNITEWYGGFVTADDFLVDSNCTSGSGHAIYVKNCDFDASVSGFGGIRIQGSVNVDLDIINSNINPTYISLTGTHTIISDREMRTQHVQDFTNTTASTSVSTGALTVAGGVGVAGDIFAGDINITSNEVHIGSDAGTITQGSVAVAVGRKCGETSQGTQSVALGYFAGNDTQGADAVAVGQRTALTTQGAGSVAIGSEAGRGSLGADAVAIGTRAGFGTSTANSVYIGNRAGETAGSYTGCIVLNSLGTAINPAANNQLKIRSGSSELIHDATGLSTNIDVESTSSSTGSISCPGGIGCGKKMFCGGGILLNPITAPTGVEGLLYYDSTANKLKFYNGSSYETITSS